MIESATPSGSNSLDTRVGLTPALELIRTGDAHGLLVYRIDRRARSRAAEQLLAAIRRMGGEVFTTSAAEAGTSGRTPLTRRAG
jgi:hypothetical protein